MVKSTLEHQSNHSLRYLTLEGIKISYFSIDQNHKTDTASARICGCRLPIVAIVDLIQNTTRRTQQHMCTMGQVLASNMALDH